MKHYKVVGVSVAVLGNNRVLWEDAAGFADLEERKPATPQTLFLAGSISKPFAATGYRSNGSPIPGKRNTYPEMAAAGLWTTAGDLARFAIALQKSLRGDKGAILSEATASARSRRIEGCWRFFLPITRSVPRSNSDCCAMPRTRSKN